MLLGYSFGKQRILVVWMVIKVCSLGSGSKEENVLFGFFLNEVFFKLYSAMLLKAP